MVGADVVRRYTEKMAARVSTRFLINKLMNSVNFIQRRYRIKTKWASTRPSFPATSLALQHLDSTCGPELGALWPSVRVGLLSEQKYGAMVNSFAATDDVVSDFHARGCRDFIHKASCREQLHDDGAGHETCNIKTDPLFSSNIKCFVFPRGDISHFKPARPDSNGLLSYYLMDAASLLPVLALDVKEGQTVLDLCAGPGGKTMALLQSQAVRFLWANDLSGSRTARLRRTLQSYVPKELLEEDILHVTSFDGRKSSSLEDHTFDKVLVDVPCTTDRHSVKEEENNIFKRSRTRERQTLPFLQMELLLAGIQATKRGSEILYSTCSLSHLQNECVVEQAISIAQHELDITVQVQDLSSFTKLFSDTFQFAPRSNVGELVLPHLCANFGPIYMCKLRRIS